jgi:hypothetical protein
MEARLYPRKLLHFPANKQVDLAAGKQAGTSRSFHE